MTNETHKMCMAMYHDDWQISITYIHEHIVQTLLDYSSIHNITLKGNIIWDFADNLLLQDISRNTGK